MHGLLLAGMRLASGAPVAAMRVAGLSLLERAAFVARDAGVTAAVVVAERPLQAALRAAIQRADLGVELIYADPLAERDTILRVLGEKDPVAVVRADVAHTRHASPALKDAEPGDVLVDEREGPLRGAEGLRLATGSTWVGLAVLKPREVGGLLDGLGREPTRGDALALDREVAAGRAQSVSVTGLQWQAVRSDAEGRAAERLLFKSLSKPADGWVSVHLNRPISTSVTRLLVDLPVHPNHASVAVFVISMAGCAALAWGDHYWLPLLGAFLIQCGSILDGVDGELARLRYQGSFVGAWLDNAGDDITTVMYICAVTTNLARFGHSPIWTWMGVSGAVCAVIAIAVSYTYIISIGSPCVQDYPSGVERAATAKTPFKKIWGFIAYASKRDTMNLTFLGFALVGLLQGIATCLFLGAVLTCLVFVRARFRLRREARALHGTALGGPEE